MPFAQIYLVEGRTEDRKRPVIPTALDARRAWMVISPLMKNTPKIHDASSGSLNPPRVPTDRMTATGAVAAKTHPMKPLAA